MRKTKKKTRLEGDTQIDSLHISINLKGTKPKNMPRYSKIRGNQSAYRGISHHKVCILSAIDERDKMIFEIAGLGPETKEMISEWIDYFDEGEDKILVSDMKQGYGILATSSKRKHIEIKSGTYVSETGESLSSINQLHSEFQLLYSHYHGVSIRHLQGYLDFFVLCKQMKYKYQNNKEKALNSMKKLVKESFTLKKKQVYKKVHPIDLYQAYGEYNYGCYS